MVKSRYVDFKAVGDDERIVQSMSHRTYVSFDVFRNSYKHRISVLGKEELEEFITYPYVGLNSDDKIRWMVASCHPLELDARLKHMERTDAPLPYRVTQVSDDKVVFYWYLRIPVKLTLSGWSRSEAFYKTTYISFCKAFKLHRERYHFYTYNPLYISYKTGRFVDAEYDIKDFRRGVKNRYDDTFYFDAQDYIFKVTSAYARKAYRDFRPKSNERESFTRLLLEWMEEIDTSEWPDIYKVSYEDVVDYIVNYLFTYYDKIIEDFPTIQSRRASKQGEVRRNAFLQQVLELRRSGYSYKDISRQTGIPLTTTKRWVAKYGSKQDHFDDQNNRFLSA